MKIGLAAALVGIGYVLLYYGVNWVFYAYAPKPTDKWNGIYPMPGIPFATLLGFPPKNNAAQPPFAVPK